MPAPGQRRGLLRSIVREPLLQFTVLGGLLFWLLPAPEPAPDVIDVSARTITALADNWSQTWDRQPDPQTIADLIERYVREEVYLREADRLGLISGDGVVRAQMMNKLEILAAGDSALRAPEAEELNAFFTANRDRYTPPVRWTFTQVFLGADETQARRLAGQGEDLQPVSGLPSSTLPPAMRAATHQQVANVFGRDFADALQSLPPAKPQLLPSGFGFHLVTLEPAALVQPPQLADVREAVVADWQAEQARLAIARDYIQRKARYQVRVAGQDQ